MNSVVGQRKFASGQRTVEEKRKTTTLMEEPSGGFHEKQKHGRGSILKNIMFLHRWEDFS